MTASGDDFDSVPVGLHTFVDESYGKDDYYVGGIVVTTSELATLEAELSDFKHVLAEKFDVPMDIELHAHEIMHGLDSWTCLNGQVHESVWVCRRVVQMVVNSGARIHMQGVNVRQLNARYQYPDSPYRVCLRHLLERVQDECTKRTLRSAVTADILDESGAASAAISGFTRQRTPGFRPTRLSHIQPMSYVDSSSNLGVQAADMVTYVIRRYREVRDAHPKAIKAARQLYNTAAPNIKSCRRWDP